MRNLTSLLQRITKSLNRNELTQTNIISTIKKLTKVELRHEDISLQNGVLSISLNPTAKNEVRLKEAGIIEDLRSRQIYINRILYK